MSKRLLYIDYLSQSGHINFNKTFIKDISNLDLKIDFIFRKNYSASFGIKKNVLTIPDRFYLSANSFIMRLNYFKILRYIDKKINLNNYDYVLLSSYDEVSLYFSRIRSKLILINHNNLANLDNIIKRFFFKRISNVNYNVVFENYMMDNLKKFQIKNLFKISHGLPDPLRVSNIKNTIFLKNQTIKFDSFEKLIFIPSLSSLDKKFILQLILDKDFINFLNANNVLLILKTKELFNVNMTNFIVINEFLSDIDYNSIFIKSNLIILIYPITFRNRVSSVFFQCIANNKTCLINSNKALNEFKNKINYECYFESKDELISKIKFNINKEINNKYSYNVKPKQDFEFLLDCINKNKING